MIMITKFKNPQNNFKIYESEMVMTSLSAGVIMPCRICQHWRIDEAFAHMLYKLHSHVLPMHIYALQKYGCTTNKGFQRDDFRRKD